MKKHRDLVLNRDGNPVSGIFVRVKLAGTSTDAVIYSDNGITVKSNPVITDSNGNFSFYVADGRYDLVYSGSGFSDWTDTDVVIEDLLNRGEVKDTGAVGDGVTDDTAAFNLAAASGTTVYVTKGDYVVSAPTASAMWFIEDGAYIRGLPDINPGAGGGVINDTSRLTGRIFHLQNITNESGIRMGDSDPWLEKSVRGFTESITEVSVVSPTGQIALCGASRTSDDLAANFACIGINGYGINDNTTNPEPAWAAYLEARRSAGAGAAYAVEMDMINTGSEFNLDPFTTISPTSGQTVNAWLTNGGGDVAWGGNKASAAIAIHANPQQFLRGIVIRSGSLDSTISEAMAVPTGAKLAWYASSGVVNSLIDHRQIKQKTVISSSLGNAHESRKQRDSGAESVDLDTVTRHSYYGCSGSSADYLGGYQQVIQRANFSSGHARFSYDISARNGIDGTYSECSLNGLANKSFAPNPDNSISLGTGSFRWSVVYSSTGAINTSDERTKTFIDINAAEVAVAKELKNVLGKFKFNDAIEEKGFETARLHFGIGAQTVVATFERHGLDATKYALLCYDEWDEQPEVKDDEGTVIQEYREAGNRYGIRYDELLAFILSAI